jgi:hypothetical protein
MSLRAFFLLPAVLCALIVVPARAQDSLKDAAARQKIILEQVQADYEDAKKEATKLAADNPARAIVVLRTMRDKIADNADLPDAERARMMTYLEFRIGNLTKRIDTEKTIALTPAPSARAQEEKRKAQEAEALKQDLAKLEQLRREGRTDEARIQAALIQRDHPNNPAVQADKMRTDVLAAKDKDADIKARKEMAFLQVGQSLEESLIAPARDYTFPDAQKWREITEKRTRPKMTPEEEKVMKALTQPVTIDLKDSTLEAVIGLLREKTGLPINDPPKPILEEKGITYQTPISVSLSEVTTRTVLKKVLSDVGLTYIVKGGAVQITTPERAKETLTVRTYYIGDLLTFAPEVRFNPYAQQVQAQAVNDIIGLIVGSVDPDSWWTKGGPGRIVFDPRTGSLIVSQTAEIHYMLSMGRGR